jgi:protein involved in polysaccharide export with SLBB domain
MKMRVLEAVCFSLMLVVVRAADLRGQERDYSQPEGASVQTRAIDEADSRAEQQAERLVSLAPEKIILLLEQEPGLFLEIKRMLVRKAYAQGRLLDAKELTDEAVFRMVRDDEETRALITQQIVDRGYVRAKPTRQEIVREYELQQKLARANARQEQAYNEELPGAERESSQENPNGTQPANRSPQYPPAYPQNVPLQEAPQPSSPQTPIPDQRRALMQASLGSYTSQDNSGGLPLNVVNGGQQQISPEQIQQLISAYGKSGAQSTGGQPDLAKLAASLGNSNASPRLNQLPQSQEEAYASQQLPTILPQQTRLQTDSAYVRRQMQERRPAHTTEDQPAVLHRSSPYADVPSLYDLYSQYSRRPSVLKRFGLDIFETGTGNLDQLPMDLPAGPDYVLGPGDAVSIDFWGSVSQRLHRVIDRSGRLSLPEVGTIQVSGHSLGDVQRIVQSALRSQYRELDANVSLEGLRTVRIYVVGDVQRPGAYDVSSLSTPLNALYEAGGPTSKGSMRMVKHYRGNQLVENVDLYQLLLRGVQAGTQRLESGDTILVPPLGQEITVEGMIRRPAIYELGGEKNLAEVLELASGVLPSGTLRHVDVERVEAHQNRSMLRLDIPESDSPESQALATVTEALEKFQVQDGDRIKISPILPFSDKTVFLDGHVFRPGKYAYRDGMKITDLVHNYSDLLPEPYKQHAEIIRLSAPDYKPQIIAFNLGDALAGKNPALTLKPFDTIRVFSRFDFEDPPIITVSGEVRDPGDHVTNGATYLRDAIFLAGNTAQDAELEDVQVFRKTHDGKMQVINANLRKAIAGDPNENVLLEPQDRVFVHKDVLRLDPPTVEVQGEVARPGKYPLGTDMTATELVRVAGGLKRSAYTQEAELTRYTINHGEQFEGEHLPISIGQALSGEPDTDMRLRAGDVLTIRQIAGWKDIGATVKVDGEVVHPGTYGVHEGERLSDVIARAGGFRASAYPYGSIFERLQVREIEEKNRVQLIAQAQQEGGGLGTGASDPAQDASLVQWRDTLHQLQTTPPLGRMVIHISSGKSWVHTPADIQLRAGDSIYIPKKPNFVMVQGAVYNQTGIEFRPGKSASWYLRQAGGPTSTADKKNVFVVRADGTVAGGPKGLFNGGALESAMQPGDMIVVPSKAIGGGFKWKETLQVAQLVSAIGIAVQVARGF